MRRRSGPPKPPLPPEPGDLSWGAETDGEGYYSPTRWGRTDHLSVFVRPDGCTVVHEGRPVTDEDEADVLRLLGLSRVRRGYRSNRSRELWCEPGFLEPIVSAMIAAREELLRRPDLLVRRRPPLRGDTSAR